MIASLNGKLESLGSDWAVINVGGIGFQVFIPSPTLSTLGSVGGEDLAAQGSLLGISFTQGIGTSRTTGHDDHVGQLVLEELVEPILQQRVVVEGAGTGHDDVESLFSVHSGGLVAFSL